MRRWLLKSILTSVLCRFTNNERQTTTVKIVNEYAATQLAAKCGPDFVTSLINSTGALHNPALKGWLLELWFFASITNGGSFTYLDSSNQQYTWELCTWSLFDPLNKDKELITRFEANHWLKPLVSCCMPNPVCLQIELTLTL